MDLVVGFISASFYFKDFHLYSEKMGLMLRATDRKSESAERYTNVLLVLIFSWDLMAITKNIELHQLYSLSLGCVILLNNKSI